MTRRNLAAALSACATLWLAGCSNDTTAPSQTSPAETPQIQAATAEVAALAAEVRTLAAGQGITGLQRPAPVRRELSLLGRAPRRRRSSSHPCVTARRTCRRPRPPWRSASR